MVSEFFSHFRDISFVYNAIVVLLSIGLIISSLEDVINYSIYAKGGLLSWKISKHRSSFLLNGHFSKIFDFLLNDRNFPFVLYLKLFLVIALFVLAVSGIISPFLVMSVFVLMLLLSLRSQFGLDGAYQMNLVVLFGLTMATLSGLHSKIASVCMWFIAGELILSYFIAGLAKAFSPIWRKTHALNAIFSTKTYGHETIFKLITKNTYLAFIFCWPMLLFEMFFTAAFLSEYICIAFCAIGILFHLFNAVFMGLNTFLFAFISTYPAIFYCFSQIN